MNGILAPEWRAGKFAAAVRDHLVDVHIELRAASSHPDMEREHVMMLAGEDFVAGFNNQLVLLIAEPLASMICDRRRLLQNGIRGDHLARHQVLADAEVLERALSLRPPQLVHGDFNHTEAICFFTHLSHLIPSPFIYAST